MSDMNDKVALVTGASSGIGQATAEAFAARGAKVVLAARREKELASLTKEIQVRGGNATFIITDVSKAEDIQRMIAHATQTYGRLDYAVNNAGIEGRIAPILDLTEEEWDRTLDTNLKSTFLCLQQEARAMLQAGRGGSIVNVGSVNSFIGFPGGSAYVASKHGLVGLTSTASAELASQGIRVNLVCPGMIDTPMHQRARQILGNELYDNFLSQRVHTRRVGRPEEIAHSIVFLCSDDASYITGTTLTPDGGFHLTI
jgi:NAD(P)-dependent dehydrogenase (short-subunit alcohol dehydrogenase family)